MLTIFLLIMTFRWAKVSIFFLINNHLIDYPTPMNLSYMWSFGSLAGICLVIQIVSGIFLAMHYTPHISLAFFSVEHIMRDVSFGWLLRYIHANGASFFFLLVYTHIVRGFYYNSFLYPREGLWVSGVVLFILMMATGFIGYVLPWGQMSFWGATVITNLISAIPFVGDSIVEWFWGGFSVNNATLNRFFSLHYFLPFVIIGMVLLHLMLLHSEGSTNPLGFDVLSEKVSFFPLFYVKDLLAVLVFILIFSIFVFFFPNILGHSDNYICANPMVTPTHIVPEWYFLPFYAILRSIPHKLGGVLAMGFALVGLIFIPFLSTSETRSSNFRPLFRYFFWIFVSICFVLGWIGQNVVEYPYIEIGQIATFWYFFHLFVFLPFSGWFESILIRSLLFFINQVLSMRLIYVI